jgi:hypothetical protein
MHGTFRKPIPPSHYIAMNVQNLNMVYKWPKKTQRISSSCKWHLGCGGGSNLGIYLTPWIFRRNQNSNKKFFAESELLYDWRFTANHFILATSPLRLTTSYFIFQLNTCCYRPCLWWEDGSVVYNCCWSSPAKSFSCPSPEGHNHILLSQIRDSPNLEGQVPVFISPRNRVASYDSQGYGGGIRPRLHTGNQFWAKLIAYNPWYDTDRIENDKSNNSSTVAYIFVVVVTFLPRRYLATIGFLQSLCLATIKWYTYRQTCPCCESTSGP